MVNLKSHEKIAFEFSGGKDSIVCLMQLLPQIGRITVFWMNTGDAFPETLAQMDEVKKLCPNFVEIKSDQPKSLLNHGYPVDILPVRNHINVQYLTQINRVPLQAFTSCCQANLMQPMHNAVVSFGATMIIRGQKACDHHKSPLKSGDVVGGIEYLFPIEDWSDERVLDFVKDSPLLPRHYEYANTSLDCMHCTAYLEENKWKLPYLEKFHPDIGAEVRKRLKIIKAEIQADFQFLDGV